MLYAQEKGYFKDAGIDLEATAVQGGPAAVAALASGEADVGYAAFVPPINARIGGVPLKLFLTLAHEQAPDHLATFITASKSSGITDMKGAKGKNISFNANGGLCELMWRSHLAATGMKIEDVNVVVLPFPEQEKALEQGSIDATCTVNPFYASIKSNAAIGAFDVAKGMLADLTEPSVQDGLFATEDWLGKNGDAAVKLAQVMDRARKELMADRALMEAEAVKHMELTPEAAKSFFLPIVKMEMNISGADVQRVLDAMIATGMQEGPLNGADFVAEIKY
jgi:ABC-type nitrate/sulfonate/bicarbonate transport system substrate-binding protein